MRLAGFILLGVGLLCVLGSIGYTVYSLLSAFSAAHDVDSAGRTSSASSGMSLSTSLSVGSFGLIATIAGIIVLAAWNRSSRY